MHRDNLCVRLSFVAAACFAAHALLGGCEAIAGLDTLHVASSAVDGGADASYGSQTGPDAASGGHDAAPGAADTGASLSGDARVCQGLSADCTNAEPRDAASSVGPLDAAVGLADAASLDAGQGSADAASRDAGPGPVDAAPVDAAGPSDAGPHDAASPADTAPVRTDLGKGDGSDVILMGDSWISNTLQSEGTGGGIAPSLLSASTQPYRNYAIQGTSLLQDAVFGPAIPKQWGTAKSADPDIKTVVMAAGGNDIIQGSQQLSDDCKQGGALCAMKLKEIRDALAALWAQMASAGVRDVVHILYNEDTTRLKDAAGHASALQTVCNAVPAPLRCHLLATDNLVNGALATDGIHPLQAANDRIAIAIVALMQSEGMRR
jgi:hypothetical protein